MKAFKLNSKHAGQVKLILRQKLFKEIGAIGDLVGQEVYAVGGYVRDRLLKRKKVKDIDFVVVGNGPEFAEQVAQRLGSSNLTIYKKFGTAMLKHHGYILEFVGARKESYREDSRNPEVVQADLSQDLARRDFTINAMAVGLNAHTFGQIMDPFSGQQDLNNKIIRTPLEPEVTFFDDPLRIMRAIRFATQLGFTIAEDTLAAMIKTRDRLEIISQERITEELLKILAADQPSIGLMLMSETGVLDIVLPEIAELRGVEQRGEHHHKDVFKHTLKVLDNLAAVSNNLSLRLAALYHDVAKPKTKVFKEDLGWTFHGHEEVGTRMLPKIFNRLRLSNQILKYVQKIIRLHMRPIHLTDETVTDSGIRRLLVQAGVDIDDLLTLCRADITSGNPQKVKNHLANFDFVVKRLQEVEAKDRMRTFQSPVRGDEIMQVCGIIEGPRVGILKEMIEEAILAGAIPNDHDAALAYLLEIKDLAPNEK